MLVEEGLLTPEQLEEALENQVTTGHPLGEIAVELGFVSRMALSGVLSAHDGVELKSETGFGTGLRAELERREGSELLPTTEFIVALPPLEAFPSADDARLADLRDARVAELENDLAARRDEADARDGRIAELEGELAELRHAAEQAHDEVSRLTDLEAELASLRQRAEDGQDETAQLVETLSVRDGELAARDRELAAVRSAYEHRSEQAARFAQRARERSERIAQLESRENREAKSDDEPPTSAPAGYVVFAQLARRYALVECDGAVPAEDATLDLPGIDAGLLRVVGVGRSPLPNDPRSCVFAEYVHGSA